MRTDQRAVIGRGDGEQVSLGGVDITFKIDGQTTGGAFSVCETSAEPGRLIPPHLHETEDEYSYVIDGRIGVLIGDQEHIVEAGSWIFKPRGIPHAYWNPGPEPTHVIEIIAPSGFEGFFRELSRIVGADGPPDMEAIAGTAERYHHHFHPELAPPLIERYGLRLIGT